MQFCLVHDAKIDVWNVITGIPSNGHVDFVWKDLVVILWSVNTSVDRVASQRIKTCYNAINSLHYIDTFNWDVENTNVEIETSLVRMF